MAFSFASAPLKQKNTFEKPGPAISQSFSASFTFAGNTVDGLATHKLSAWRLMASTMRLFPWPAFT
jgi:hypothetical protein